ncbi:MAG: ribbon-helix-helix domain-containing protein [Candidatus Thiodiazotropha sp. (ex. Lucinisca nassula)]|nr:ribbon-helix-helix domain-containing protein [Candidatus Thiodiazotropha sp. (ex. Lucinisca nassula)]
MDGDPGIAGVTERLAHLHGNLGGIESRDGQRDPISEKAQVQERLVRMKMHRTQIYLPHQQVGQIERLQIKSGLSMAEHIRRAIDEYLARQNKQIMEVKHETE